MWGIRRSGGRLHGGADRLASPMCLLQARTLDHHALPLSRLPLSPERHHKQTRQQTSCVGGREEAQRGTCESLVHQTVHQAATAGGVPANCSPQPKLP